MTPFRFLFALVITAAASIAVGEADAATIAVSYEHGHPDVLINGYRTEAMGTFRLSDGDADHLALCIEAHEPHSTRQDAYAPVANGVASAHLDTLLWLLDRQVALDDDVAVAAASLAWYYAEARRSIGPLVWSDGNRDFAAIGPLAPEPWDALPRFSLSHMIGLRTGYTDLDHVETAVAVLHRRVEAMRGPWTLAARDQRFRLTGPAGPIAGQPVEVTSTVGGEPPRTAVLTTDAAGWVTPSVGEPDDGVVITATADSPGVHREWDGDAGIQRMATATNRRVTASFEVAPLPRHLHVRKSSTDATIAVAGGEFELLDVAGASVGTAVSGDDGVAPFSPVDPVRHPGPYLLRETVAPPGLDRTAPDVRLDDLSTDPEHPTVVEMVDEPSTVPLRVRKQLSEPDVGPVDRSGFAFTIVRRSDGWSDELATGPDGATDPLDVALGTYDVCELSTPAWANSLLDGGCVEVIVDLGAVAAGATVAIDYVNLVPAIEIDTLARGETDDDRQVSTLGGPAGDRVWLTGLVPGTTYELTGTAFFVETNDPVASATETFMAESTELVIELAVDLPELPPGVIVFAEELRIGERVVARHLDFADADQTLTIVAPPTTTTTTTTTSTTTTTTVAVPTTSTTAPSTTTTTTTTTTTVPIATSTSTTVATTTLPVPVVTPPVQQPPVPPTLPATGSDAAGALLRAADVGFVLGVGLVALVGFLPRRDPDPLDRA